MLDSTQKIPKIEALAEQFASEITLNCIDPIGVQTHFFVCLVDKNTAPLFYFVEI